MYETLYADVNHYESGNSCDISISSGSRTLSDKISDEISLDNIQKKKKSKNFNEVEGNEK